MRFNTLKHNRAVRILFWDLGTHLSTASSPQFLGFSFNYRVLVTQLALDLLEALLCHVSLKMIRHLDRAIRNTFTL
jgi:hypothetical protein